EASRSRGPELANARRSLCEARRERGPPVEDVRGLSWASTDGRKSRGASPEGRLHLRSASSVVLAGRESFGSGATHRDRARAQFACLPGGARQSRAGRGFVRPRSRAVTRVTANRRRLGFKFSACK